VIPKEVILSQWGEGGGVETQHGGRGGSDTAWISVIPERVPTWLAKLGGRPRAAASLIASLTGREPI
jgi:hypothetical protein